MNRKEFLKYGAGSFVVPSMFNGLGIAKRANSWINSLSSAIVDTDKVLVLVRLDGGNDGLNTVIPLDQYGRLTMAREKVIIPENKVLRLDGLDQVGLHPAMGKMRDLYNEGKLKIIRSVGYPNPNYSHFRSTDIWMTASDSDEIIVSGWAGRYLQNEFPNFPVDFPNEDMPDPLSLEIGSFLSLAFQGPTNAMGMSISDPSDFYELIGGGIGEVPNTPAGEKLAHVRLIKRQSNAYGQVVKDAYESVNSQGEYPDTFLGEQLKIVSRLIAGGLKTRIYMVNIGGFDTHDRQVDPADHTRGFHAELLREVSDAIAAFMEDLRFQGTDKRVVGMTFSEFGRRIISNFSDGTDHGAAAPMFVFGHEIEGGMLGENPFIPLNATPADNLPMQYDFRSVYATMLQDWFCLPSDEVQLVMRNDFPILPLIANSDCVSTSTRDQYRNAGQTIISAYPNPFTERTTISFQSDGGQCLVQVFNAHGQLVATPAHGAYAMGEHQLDWDSETLPAGHYHLRLQNGLLQQVRPVLKVR
ncbi:MAG: DUF1501 domain-containing protein [Bacteroidota bacterium]